MLESPHTLLLLFSPSHTTLLRRLPRQPGVGPEGNGLLPGQGVDDDPLVANVEVAEGTPGLDDGCLSASTVREDDSRMNRGRHLSC